jgi:hypothetical protein
LAGPERLETPWPPELRGMATRGRNFLLPFVLRPRASR